MENKDIKKSYRPNVAAVVVSSNYPEKCEIFIGERSDIDGAWQFPQGGIDDGEDPKEAIIRELKEEIGTDNVEFVAEFPDWISYDFPPTVAKKMYPYDGQIQKYFLIRLNSNEDINLLTKEPEFSSYRFIDVESVLEEVSFFKRSIYAKVINHFKKNGYL